MKSTSLITHARILFATALLIGITWPLYGRVISLFTDAPFKNASRETPLLSTCTILILFFIVVPIVNARFINPWIETKNRITQYLRTCSIYKTLKKTSKNAFHRKKVKINLKF